MLRILLLNRYVIKRKKLLKKAKKIVPGNIEKLSKKALLKIVNRQNIANNLRTVFSSTNKRSVYLIIQN